MRRCLDCHVLIRSGSRCPGCEGVRGRARLAASGQAHAVRRQAAIGMGRWAQRKVRAAVLARDGFRCVRCGATADLQYDHIVPLARGGATTEANGQTLCGRCNRAKGVGGGSKVQRGVPPTPTQSPNRPRVQNGPDFEGGA